MKNTALILIVVLLASAIVYAGLNSSYFKKVPNDSSPKVIVKKPVSDGSKNAANPNRDTAVVAGLKVELGGIFSESGSYECKFEKTVSNIKTSNTAYFSNAKMSFESKVTTGKNSTTTRGVYDGNIVHIWVEGNKNGIKIQPKTIKDFPSVIPEEVLNGSIINGVTGASGWKCGSWNVDSLKLSLPSNVIFY